MASEQLPRGTTPGGRGRISSGAAVSPTAMVNISGGVDSVYAALKALQSGQSLLLHHCVLKSRTNRWQQERKAVQHALAYYRGLGLDKFIYVETSFDYGKISYLIYDVELIGFLTGLILRNPRYNSIKQVIISVNKDDPSGRDQNTPRRVVSNALATTVLGDRKIEFLYPHVDMTKKDMLRDTPKDLLEKLWWCRTPKNNNACGTCRPCREINPILKKLT
jgi:7-cyano-7-deazaguanine synthase in queuosine biosynthesis